MIYIYVYVDIYYNDISLQSIKEPQNLLRKIILYINDNYINLIFKPILLNSKCFEPFSEIQ